MRKGWIGICALALSLAAPADAATEGQIITVNPIVLKDAAQKKDVILRVIVPAAGGRVPVILFSHGAQYSKDDYLPLTEYWAAHGYAVIAPTFDDSTSLGIPRGDDRQKFAWRSRLLDMHKVIDSLDEIERASPILKGRFDSKKIIAAGHSFGGHTTATLVNGTMPDENTDLTDKRVLAAAALAPPGYAKGFRNVAWPDKIKPMLMIVGDQDITPGFSDTWQVHADYYMKGPNGQCMAVMAGMKHYLGGILGTNRTEEGQPPNAAALSEIQRMTLAFFDTQAKGSNAWPQLRDELLKTRPAPLAQFECK